MDITKANVNVLEKGVCLLDFWAPWCMPCKMMAPVLDQIAAANADIIVGKINVDEEQELAINYEIKAMPTFVVLKDGKILDKQVGVKSKSELQQMIDKAKS